MTVPKVVRQNYPPIPEDASERDIVDEYYLYYDEERRPQRALVGRVYCPLNYVRPEDTLFDMHNPVALAAKKKYARQIKNRRRYNRTLSKRALEQQ